MGFNVIFILLNANQFRCLTRSNRSTDNVPQADRLVNDDRLSARLNLIEIHRNSARLLLCTKLVEYLDKNK